MTNVWVAQNPPGFAFVEFDHISEADLAVSEMNGKSFLGSTNKIRVEHSHGGKSRNGRRGGGRFDGSRSFGGRGFSGDSGYRSNGGEYRRIGREGGGFGGGSGGRFDNGDKRRPFNSGGGGGGRFPSGGGGPPRYGRSDRPYGGPRRSRSPSGRRYALIVANNPEYFLKFNFINLIFFLFLLCVFLSVFFISYTIRTS